MNGSGFRVPGWAVSAIAIAILVLTVGFKFGRMYDRLDNTLETMEARLCRIERAVNVQPGLGCPTAPQSGGGR